MRLRFDRPMSPILGPSALALGVGFLAVTALVLVQPRLGFDVVVTRWFGSRQEPWLIVAMDIVRLVAIQLPLVLTPVLVIILWRRRGASDGLLLLGTVAATLVISVATKLSIARPRPEPALLRIPTDDTDWSFPSSSVAIAVVFWGVLLALRPRHRYRAFVPAGAVALAMIGVSRLYVGEHWFSDVVAGYLAGAAVLAIGLRIWVRAGGAPSGRARIQDSRDRESGQVTDPTTKGIQ